MDEGEFLDSLILGQIFEDLARDEPVWRAVYKDVGEQEFAKRVLQVAKKANKPRRSSPKPLPRIVPSNACPVFSTAAGFWEEGRRLPFWSAFEVTHNHQHLSR